jgi:pSer/pThr/pTyr-binding forkhead associated (FHA) protein
MCGRDNPSHLIFCQECGQRLAPRVATPASSVGGGPPTSPLAATTSAPVLGANPPPGPASKARPPAPEVSFVKRGDVAQPTPPSLPLPLGESAATWPALACTLCGTANQAGQRFCMTCGQPLASSDDEGPNRIGAIELMRTVTDSPRAEAPAPQSGSSSEARERRPTQGIADTVSDAAGAPIAPGRVIEVGSSTAGLRESHLSCPRCRGAYDSGAQFCRFCGLPLAGIAPQGVAAAPAAMRHATRHATTPEILAVREGAGEYSIMAPGTPSALARVVLITRDGHEGPSHPLGATTDFGRIEGDILFPEDQYVSPRHARIVARRGAFFVRDLESTNGVFVRVPFAVRTGDDIEGDRGASAGGPSARGAHSPHLPTGGDDKSTIRGHHSGSLSNSREPGAPHLPAEQPLSDQELFLVGQQVLRFEVVKQAEEAFGAASENGTLLFGTPAAPRYARLSQRTIEGVVRDIFHLRRAETVIGRESGDIVFTDDPFLSRRHAVLRMHNSEGQKRRFTLADLGSSNGTFLRIRDEVRLSDGDHFRIGQQLLRFSISAPSGGA